MRSACATCTPCGGQSCKSRNARRRASSARVRTPRFRQIDATWVSGHRRTAPPRRPVWSRRPRSSQPPAAQWRSARCRTVQRPDAAALVRSRPAAAGVPSRRPGCGLAAGWRHTGIPTDGALIADPDFPWASPAGLMTTTSVDTSARPQRKPSGPAAIPQAASMLLRLELVSQLVMIAAAASLYGHRLTCTNKPRITNYSGTRSGRRRGREP